MSTLRHFVWSALMVLASVSSSAEESHPPRDVNSHHLFTPPADKEAWKERAKELRMRVLFSVGLWPMPERTPLNPIITGRYEAEDFIVENVALETLPGFFLCGNLYRPKSGKGLFPAIANPHGHWEEGRLTQQPDVGPASAPPSKPLAGKANLTGIGVNLARQGFVVFAYDMAGYNDTNQVRHREFTKDLKSWLWGVSMMGLQTWNSLRVVDYLESLPDVDKKRIGVTGASGGATQTFILTAVDPRIQAAVPVNMVSAHMQGGCLCENGPGLRVDTDNVEIMSLFAPKPVLLVSCTGDWTKHTLTEEFPVLQNIYKLYGKPECTDAVQYNYEHNYNLESREAMYAWFGHWLRKLEDTSGCVDKPYTLEPAKLRVWNAEHPQPSSALKEEAFHTELIHRVSSKLSADLPKKKSDLNKFREVYEPALRLSLGVTVPSKNIPAASIPSSTLKKHSVLIATAEGDAAANENAKALQAALEAKGIGAMVLALPGIQTTTAAQWDKFFSTYNRTPLGDRVQSIVDTAAAARAGSVKHLDVVGLGKAGLWALYARAISPHLEGIVFDADHFENQNDQAFLTDQFAPGLRMAGDVQTALVLSTKSKLWAFNTGSSFDTSPINEFLSDCRTYSAFEDTLKPEQIAEKLVRK